MMTTKASTKGGEAATTDEEERAKIEAEMGLNAAREKPEDEARFSSVVFVDVVVSLRLVLLLLLLLLFRFFVLLLLLLLFLGETCVCVKPAH